MDCVITGELGTGALLLQIPLVNGLTSANTQVATLMQGKLNIEQSSFMAMLSTIQC